jgi:DNA recombination protein RmuC
MSEGVVLAIVGFVALAIGLVVGLLVARARTSAQVDAAVAKASAASQVTEATLTERAASLARALEVEQHEHSALKRSAEGWRTSLDDASNQIATLTERAARVPALVADIQALESAAREREAEHLRVATLNGQNAERAVQLAEQLTDSQQALTATQARLDASEAALNAANQAKATFQQQAVRVPELEQELAALRSSLSTAHDELASLRESSGRATSGLAAELKAEREALSLARAELTQQTAKKEAAEERGASLTEELTDLRARTEEERQSSAEKLQLLVEAKEALATQFKALASEILEEKSKRFAEQNQTSLGQLLEPLKTQLTEFKGRVEEVYDKEGKERFALSEQVRQLVALNNTLSEDAKNLTMALKGQAKTQGNWGELILERVLEASGLRKGHEYKVQESQQREDGTRAQPDVVIELPEERRLVVDAKVSLVAYERYVAAESDDARAVHAKQHLDSVRGHIKGLSEKRYQELYGLSSMDFVLAFVPIEPAFMLAVTTDGDLFMDAWQRNVLLVSPSTLLFVVRTVAHLWRQEAQSRNTQEIAKRGAELYDRLHGFVIELQKVGKSLEQAQTAFTAAHNKLAVNKGNVIRQAEMLRDLGVKPTKSLPQPLVQQAMESDDAVVPPIEVGPAELTMNAMLSSRSAE